jgi:hypothetical protein
MKSLFPASLALISLLAPAFALTDDDLTPAALAGKTLTFTVESGTAPLAASGVWTGTFGATPGNSFKVTKISGTTANSNGTWSYDGYIGGHAYIIDPFITGQGPSTLTLWISEGRPRYYINFDATGNSVQFGGFTIGGASVKAPEISVTDSKGDPLEDGLGKTKFSTVLVTRTGTAKKFIIKNSGTAPLGNLAIAVDGKNKSDFIVSSLKKNRLAAGESTEFTVKFKPSGFGTRKAALHLKNNDADENPFDIELTGTGAEIK